MHDSARIGSDGSRRVPDATCTHPRTGKNVMSEVKYWDSARIGSDGSRRVPDVTCTRPRTGVEYVIDARIFWNSMSEGPTGYTATEFL